MSNQCLKDDFSGICMPGYYVYLKLPSFLRQWLIHRHGGNEPVELIHGSIESMLLERVTMMPPDNVKPARQQEGELAVCIPKSKYHDIRYCNYVSEIGKKAFVELLENDFAIDVWNFLNVFGNVNKTRKYLIYAFMEQHGIVEDGTCWDDIAKIYRHKRNIFLTNQKRRERPLLSKRIEHGKR